MRLVNTSLNEGIFHIELNRPEAGNAANRELAEQLLDAVRMAQQSAEVRVILFSAAGRHFMAGGDLASLRADQTAAMELVRMVGETVATLAQCQMPIVCAVQGLVAGGGLGLALSSDVLLAEEGARFTVGSPAIGLPPDAGTTWQLVRWVGPRKAAELSLLCALVDTQSALALGLISEITPKGALMEVAWGRARQLAQGASLALRQTKQLLRQAPYAELQAQLVAEGEAFAQCIRHADFAEGVAAMLEKRKPQFF